MTAEARRAITVIRDCIEADRYAMTVHFLQRMEQRGLFWPDVQAVMDVPADVSPDGMDHHDRPRWIISGETALGGEIEVVCAIEIDETETEFITLYWQD